MSLFAEINERTAARIVSHPRAPRHTYSPIEKKPRKVAYDRRIRPNWSEPGQDAWNLNHEMADIRSRPDLMGESDEKFLDYLTRKAIRRTPSGAFEVWLSPAQADRLDSLVRRYVDPVAALVWQKRKEQAQARENPRHTVEGASADGRWLMPTFRG